MSLGRLLPGSLSITQISNNKCFVGPTELLDRKLHQHVYPLAEKYLVGNYEWLEVSCRISGAGCGFGGCGTGDRAGCGVEVELAAVVWAVARKWSWRRLWCGRWSWRWHGRWRESGVGGGCGVGGGVGGGAKRFVLGNYRQKMQNFRIWR